MNCDMCRSGACLEQDCECPCHVSDKCKGCAETLSSLTKLKQDLSDALAKAADYEAQINRLRGK